MFSSKERKQERLESYVDQQISARMYNLILGLTVLFGIVLNIGLIMTCTDFVLGLNIWVLLIGYFILCLTGSIIAHKSDNPAVSFLGYLMIAGPIGVVLSGSLPFYAMEDILLAVVLTAAIVTIMIACSSVYPEFFSKIGSTLFWTLLIVVIVELISVLVFGYSGVIFDYICVALFSLYIGYDWYKAQSYPFSVDNAIDSAIDIYLDVINLFLRILRILSKSRND